MLELSLAEASAKIRTGPPGDDDEDMGLGHWAGVVPLSLQPGAALPSPDLEAGIAIPDYVRAYRAG